MPPKNRCRVGISVYFAVFIACVLVWDESGLFSCALFCALLHELGHLAATVWYRIPIEKVDFRLFGITIGLGGATMDYRAEIVVALAGPAANGAAAVCCLLLAKFWPAASWLVTAAFFHLLLAAFNLLPVAELDGGRALEALLCRRFGPNAARTTLNILSVLFILPLAAAGFWLLFRSRGNFTLLAAAAYLGAALIAKRGMFSRSGGRRSLQ